MAQKNSNLKSPAKVTEADGKEKALKTAKKAGVFKGLMIYYSDV